MNIKGAFDPNPGNGVEVSVLANAVCYFVHNVFIVNQNGSYRLMVLHDNELLVDESYKTAKGAKIAFLKLYWYRAWQDAVKPDWTHFYRPEADWMEKLEKSSAKSLPEKDP